MTFQNSPPAKQPANKNTRPAPPEGPLLSQLAGMREARSWGERIAADFALLRQGRIAWKDMDHAAVLHGLPGTGKTMFATALAATCRLPLVLTSFGEWQGANEGHLGTCLAAMHAAFDLAIASAPCIFLIDELDSIPKRGSGNHLDAYFFQVTNSILKELDRLRPVEGVFVIGACNHPDHLDPAVIRSGRMDRMIAITLPDRSELAEIIRFHLTPDEQRGLAVLGMPLNIDRIALLCTGKTGADIEKTVRGARALARQAHESLSLAHFLEELDPPSSRPDPETQLRIAVHEAGHAVAAIRLALSNDITASVVSTGTKGGCVTLGPGEAFMTAESIEKHAVFRLAGRAAEEIVFDEPSGMSGGDDARSDLAQATILLTRAVTRLGLSGQQGLLWYPAPERNLEPGSPLADEIEERLGAAYASALDLLRKNEKLLERIAVALMKERVLAHEALVRLAGSDDGGGGTRLESKPTPLAIPYSPAQPVSPVPKEPVATPLPYYLHPQHQQQPASPDAPYGQHGHPNDYIHQLMEQGRQPHVPNNASVLPPASQHQPPPSPPDYGQHLYQPYWDPHQHAPQHGYPPPQPEPVQPVKPKIYRIPRDQRK